MKVLALKMLWDWSSSRSFSFSINKGVPIFICSVLDLQVFGTWNLDGGVSPRNGRDGI